MGATEPPTASLSGLNESPYEKVGKFWDRRREKRGGKHSLNESPYEKVGKYPTALSYGYLIGDASMKVPTKK